MIDSEASGLLEHAITNQNSSAHDCILKVARHALNAIPGLDNMTAHHVLEAIQCRTLDRTLLS